MQNDDLTPEDFYENDLTEETKVSDLRSNNIKVNNDTRRKLEDYLDKKKLENDFDYY